MDGGGNTAWMRGGAALSIALSLLFLVLGSRRLARYSLGFANAFAERWRDAHLSARVAALMARTGGQL